ncbi:hypothetical protein F4604DRAFT_1673390 [Suillus subluteus]|nr:hypothetical protein F4604DRAFT_1673390 [Suillus subluteus]
MAVVAGGRNRGSLKLGRTTSPDYSHHQLSGTYTDIAELSKSSNLPMHSTTTTVTSSDNRVMTGTLSRHESHHHLTEYLSQDTTIPDETMSEVDRLSPLPHILNDVAMWENSHPQGTAFVVVNGMMVIRPDESDATVDESEGWDWCDVSHVVVAAAQAAAASESQLEHNDGHRDAAMVSESASNLETGSLALDTMMYTYIDWPDSNSE